MSQAWHDRCLIILLALVFGLFAHVVADRWDAGNRAKRLDRVLETSEQVVDAALIENEANQKLIESNRRLEARVAALEKKDKQAKP